LFCPSTINALIGSVARAGFGNNGTDAAAIRNPKHNREKRRSTAGDFLMDAIWA